MGKIRIKMVKDSAKRIIEKNYDRVKADFQHNKKLIEDFATFPSLSFRNKVAGYLTRLYIRLQSGSVKGVSLRMHEEEREKRITELSYSTFGVDELENLYEVPSHIKEMIVEEFPFSKDIIYSQEGEEEEKSN